MSEEKIKFDYKKIDPNAGWQKVTLRFDSPKVGSFEKDGKQIPYSLWGVEVNGEEAGWFVSDEIRELFKKLNLRKGSILMIKTAYYQKIDKKGEPEPDVYGILEWKGKEYPFGKETNGKDKSTETKKKEGHYDYSGNEEFEPSITEKPEPEKSYNDLVCENFSLALDHVMAEMKKREEDAGERGLGFNSADVEKMVVSLFMALCNKR